MSIQTIEAIYDNGNIELKGKIEVKKAKLYIIVIDEKENDISPIIGSGEFIGSELHERGKRLIANI